MGNPKRNSRVSFGPDKNKETGKKTYSGFKQINGEHPYRAAVPDGFVDYPVHTRHGGEVFYFNFALAKEMGLISQNHPDALNKDLSKAILDTFSIEVINEYDIFHNKKIPKKDIREHKYMATRYLQAQHPDKKGTSSGDGRSIWNGIYIDKKPNKQITWDISSCGTGATCLSPATAIEKKYFKTGDKNASYGNGRCDFLDGVCAAIMSEIFHRNSIITERTLAVIGFKDKTSINIRASENLLRPAHFFCHLKQNKYASLKGAIDFYIDRQVKNGRWPAISANVNKYQYMLERIATYFGRAAARFESEYIFCWMDWDGDNILVDGGLIDFGSVRQFGLFHNEYRYDDVDRFSTTISEQKNKAKYIVQTFAQIADYLISGNKKSIASFKNDASIRIFSDVYYRTKMESVLYKLGLEHKYVRSLVNNLSRKDKESTRLINNFSNLSAYFEKAKSVRGPYKIQDGITRDAIFCLRDVLRELPDIYLNNNFQFLTAEKFIDIMKSNYASRQDLKLCQGRRKKIKQYQLTYKALIDCIARLSGRSVNKILREMSHRSALINRRQRVTGDSIIYISASLVKNRHKLSSIELHEIIAMFIDEQILSPEYYMGNKKPVEQLKNASTSKILAAMLKIVEECREGI